MSAVRTRKRDSIQSFYDVEIARLRAVTREYLEDMSREMSQLAYVYGLDSLAVIFEMAREEAVRLRVESDEHLKRP